MQRPIRQAETMSTVEEVNVDEPDAAPGSRHDGPPPKSRRVDPDVADLSLVDFGPRYRMDNPRRGKFIIINNMSFESATHMPYRSGSEVDADKLELDFKALGFEVTAHLNLTVGKMKEVLSTAAAENHKDCDCFGMAVLTHGDNSILYGVDSIVSIDDFLAPIKACQSLAGKPKIFIFQACRGSNFDEGMEYDEIDGLGVTAPRKKLIPLEADFLYAYSTVPGYYSWRNQAKGSWFVQSLHKMIESYVFRLDFVKLLTWVNHQVANEFKSTGQISEMKQVPSIVSMLTKDLYFTPKK